MGMRLAKGKPVGLVDRSIPAIIQMQPLACREEILPFCRQLIGYGVDLFEVDRMSAGVLGKLPEGFNMIFRIEDDADMELLSSSGISNCIVPCTPPRKQSGNYGDLWMEAENPRVLKILERLKMDGKCVMLELQAVNDREAADIAGSIEKLARYVDGIRISGLEYTELNPVGAGTWLDGLRKYFGNEVKIDICPSNGLYMAAAIAMEAVMNGADSISCTFTGAGSSVQMSSAPLEEILTAATVLQLLDTDIVLETLPETTGMFTKMTGNRIHPLKPVLGKNIFKYESGIHADGIDKNPITYEPYQPERVGLRRMLVLGKHSGKRSIIAKLREMGLECDNDTAEDILPLVREKSVEAGRSLTEQEIMELYVRQSFRKLEGMAR